jgi:hypothetical protein
MSQRPPDNTAIRLCDIGHRELHEVTGTFKGWTRADVRDWENQQIEITRHVLATSTDI